jgi:hypothetical protein
VGRILRYSNPTGGFFLKNFKYTVIGIIFLLAGYFVIDTITEGIGDKTRTQEVKTVEMGESKDLITFGRYGNTMGIFCTTSNIKRESKIFGGRLDMLKAAGDKYFFNNWKSKQDLKPDMDSLFEFEDKNINDSCHGVYTCSMDGRDIKCLAQYYIMLDNPAVNMAGDKIIFAGIRSINGIYKNEFVSDFGVYSIDMGNRVTGSQKLAKLKIRCDKIINNIDGDIDINIKSLSFITNNEILYSKRVFKAGEYSTQLFKYNLDTEKEEQLTKGKNDFLNPSLSPDGKKLAYIFFSQSYGIYGVNIVETSNISNVIYSDTGSAVIGGSTQWSPDSNKILYTVLSNSTLDGKTVGSSKIKVSDISKKTSEFIDEGYTGTFSPDSCSIAYASYKLERNDNNNTKEIEYECTGAIYKKKIGGNRDLVFQFSEDCMFSKSINLITWYK